MPARRNLRIVVSCVSFETVKVVRPIEYFKADKAYLLHYLKKEVYRDFLREVESQLNDLGIEYERVETEIYRFSPVLKTLVDIFRKEKEEGNTVYVNMAAGSNSYSAAAMVACMMEGAKPFFVGTKEFTVKPKAFYVKKKPVGLSKDVYDPFEVPTFPLKAPSEDLVRALRIFREKKEGKKSTTYRAMIKELHSADLMKRKLEKPAKDNIQSDKMFYRRHYIDKWLKMKWVEEIEDGVLELTPAGEMVTEVF